MLRYATVAHTPMIETQPVKAIEACKQAADNLRAKMQASGAMLQCEEASDVKVWMPQSLLSPVFENLIGNAIHYGREGVPVVVKVNAEPDKNCWLFSVQDNGLGIAAQYHETILEPFHRLHGGDRPGSGIGLATCRRVIERAGGRIWVESTLYQGSTFKFLLPKG